MVERKIATTSVASKMEHPQSVKELDISANWFILGYTFALKENMFFEIS